MDSNVLLDVLTEDPVWFKWSERSLSACAERAVLVINPIIYFHGTPRFWRDGASSSAGDGAVTGGRHCRTFTSVLTPRCEA